MNQFSLGPFTFTSTAAQCPQVPIEEYQAPLETLLWMQRSAPFQIGDMLRSAHDRFGDVAYQLLGPEVNAAQAMRYESVSRRVPKDVRREELSWSVHNAIAQFPRGTQVKWLDRAIREGLSSDDIRREIKATRGGG